MGVPLNLMFHVQYTMILAGGFKIFTGNLQDLNGY